MFRFYSCRCQTEFLECTGSAAFAHRSSLELAIAKHESRNKSYSIPGYCLVCNWPVFFLVDRLFGGKKEGDIWIPNWRERVVCPRCQLNNRQRAIFSLVADAAANKDDLSMYITEQITPVYSAFVAKYGTDHCIGSEYLDPSMRGGEIRKDIRHEDLEALSFPDNSFDMVISNDVLEHVPDPQKGMSEIYRTLRNGGVAFLTFPFHQSLSTSIKRAQLAEGKIIHFLPPAYHGNPLSKDGSLVFTDFGWDVLEHLCAAGFPEVSVCVYRSYEDGHLGGAQIFFYARK